MTPKEWQMLSAEALEDGVHVVFADGAKSVVPWPKLQPEISNFNEVSEMKLLNRWELYVRGVSGEELVLPWDFVRAQSS